VRYSGERYRLAAVLLLLAVMHFGLRPFLGNNRVAPDFLMLALLVYAIGTRPGNAAVAGFTVGIIRDALTLTAFGAGAFAHTVIGYLAAWSKAVFFADNLYVNAALFFFGVWLRDLLMLLVGRHAQGSDILWQLGYWSPLHALTTAVTGVVVLIVFRKWLHVRIGE
jgi:rod shape-determining protein MreD